MLQCIFFKPASTASPSLPKSPATINFNSHSPISQGGNNNSTEETPRSSTQPSSTVNLTGEYTLTNSYNEMWSRIHVIDNPNHDEQDILHTNDSSELHFSDVLKPNRKCVEEALSQIKPNTLTGLVSTYFDHSENTTNLCLRLHQIVYRARKLYTPLHDFIHLIPHDLHSISQSHCKSAFDVFQDFLRIDNPFPPPDSKNFHNMRRSFSQLKQQLDIRLRKLRSPVLCVAVFFHGISIRTNWLVSLNLMLLLKVVDLVRRAVPLALTPENDPMREELKCLQAKKEEIDVMAHKQVLRILWTGLGFAVIQAGLFFRLTFWEFSWDVMEPIAFFTTTAGIVIGYAYFLFTARDPTYQDLRKRLFLSRQRKLLTKHDFDVKRFKELQCKCKTPLDANASIRNRVGLELDLEDSFHRDY